MNRPVRTTLTLGILSAICVIPFTQIAIFYMGWPMTYKLFILVNLGIYSILLCRWSNTDIITILFPSLLLLGLAIWPDTYFGFTLVALVVLAWIRSGICYKKSPMRGVIAEIITMGGTGFILFWWPSSSLAQPLAVWLFFLVQSLYFFIIPETINQTTTFSTDPFEQTSKELARLLESNSVG